MPSISNIAQETGHESFLLLLCDKVLIKIKLHVSFEIMMFLYPIQPFNRGGHFFPLLSCIMWFNFWSIIQYVTDKLQN